MAIPILDKRERTLSVALGEYPHEMADLPVGDVACRYDDGSGWVAERKTAHDLAQSIRTGHTHTHTLIYIFMPRR